jgi:hypothetical protein
MHHPIGQTGAHAALANVLLVQMFESERASLLLSGL